MAVSGQLDPSRFDLLALQIVAAGIVDSTEGLMEFLGNTLSAHIARDSNRAIDRVWRDRLSEALDGLQSWGFVRK